MEAAVLIRRGDDDGALAVLEQAIEGGCDLGTLRARVFEDLRETPGWKAMAEQVQR